MKIPNADLAEIAQSKLGVSAGLAYLPESYNRIFHNVSPIAC